MLFAGIDLGTTSVKTVLTDESCGVLAEVSEKYETSYPHYRWSEQDPQTWLHCTLKCLNTLFEGVDRSELRGIGVTGQMNGLVALDENDRIVRPAILWNDGRCGKETKYLNEVIGYEKLRECTGNIAFASFTAPKIMWVRDNEPENYECIAKIMLPKDYIVYCLTGRHVTDVSDASGTVFYDVGARCWSDEMCRICGVKQQWLPEVLESSERVGKVTAYYEEMLGIKDVTVVAGAGDNEAAAISTNTLRDGSCNISLGTSGTIFMASDSYVYDPGNTLHVHASANGHWHLLGCVLSAASCCKWWIEQILATENYQAENDKISLGSSHVLFLPCLFGDRILNDENARATFIGMTDNTKREDMYLAIMEGVGFELRDCLEAARRSGINIKASTVCGGGAKNRIWLKILANILDIEIHIPSVEAGPSFGAAVLSMVGCGVYPDVETATDRFFSVAEKIRPEKNLVELYNVQYRKYQLIYPALKDVFRQL